VQPRAGGRHRFPDTADLEDPAGCCTRRPMERTDVNHLTSPFRFGKRRYSAALSLERGSPTIPNTNNKRSQSKAQLRKKPPGGESHSAIRSGEHSGWHALQFLCLLQQTEEGTKIKTKSLPSTHNFN